MNIQMSRTRRSHIARTGNGARYVLLLSLIAPAAVIAGPHQASKPETVSASVSLANLDLTTPAGISAAHQRLATAAQHLCHKFSDDRRVDNHAVSIDCYSEALANAVRRFEAQLKAANSEGIAVARSNP